MKNINLEIAKPGTQYSENSGSSKETTSTDLIPREWIKAAFNESERHRLITAGSFIAFYEPRRHRLTTAGSFIKEKRQEMYDAFRSQISLGNKLFRAKSDDQYSENKNAAMHMRDAQGGESYLVPPGRPKIPSPPPHWTTRMAPLDAKLSPLFWRVRHEKF